MIVALFANTKKQESSSIAKQISQFLQKKSIHLVSRDDEAEELGLPPLSKINPETIDCLILLGGDGTILRLIHHFPHLKAPVLGINLGQLGFMADIPINDLYPSLEELIEGKYTIENRIMMEGTTASQEHCFAVNEIVVHRSKSRALIDLSIHVDGDYLNTFSADGIIIATPNGSTAYSLSAGGPILTPNLNAFVITPISPHTISNRPIVLMPKNQIEIQYLSSHESIEIIYDGFSSFTMHPNEVFKIIKSERTFKIINLHRTNYFSTLRTKLGWSGKLRYSQI